MSKRFERKDAFYRKAKQEGLRARSAYKIEEIARRFRLVRPGAAVLDLGAAPGGWLQVLARLVGAKGVVVGIDLVDIAPLGPNVKTLRADIYGEDLEERLRALHPDRFDLLTSDMAPKTTGVKLADEARSLELARRALALCDDHLVEGGAFVAKVFEGREFPALLQEIRGAFSGVKLIRPEATRGRSFEIYVVATGFRGGGEDGAARDPEGN